MEQKNGSEASSGDDTYFYGNGKKIITGHRSKTEESGTKVKKQTCFGDTMRIMSFLKMKNH